MKIERHILAAMRRYMLKKHAPILDLSLGVVWVPARAQDGARFMAGFKTPHVYTGLLNDALCVVPEALQSVLEIEEQIDGYRMRRTRLKIAGGAEYPIAASENRLECVPHNRFNLAHSMFTELLAPLGFSASHREIPERALRFAAQVSARFEKACGNRAGKWRTSWRETYGDGYAFVKVSEGEDFFFIGKCY